MRADYLSKHTKLEEKVRIIDTLKNPDRLRDYKRIEETSRVGYCLIKIYHQN